MSRSSVKAQERQLSLVACLLNYRYGRTLEQIQQDIPAYGTGEAARKKFQRDRRLLDELGVPIHMEVMEGEDPSGNLHYVYRIKPGEIFARRLEFNDEELRALTWLGEQLQSLGSFPFREILADTLDKLKSAAAGGSLSEVVHILPQGRSEREEEILQQLGACVIGKESCRILYRRPDGQNQERVIHPYGLKFLYGHWYCLAWCELREAPREFRVSRIQKLELTGQTYQDRPQVDLEGWFADDSWDLGLGEGPTVSVHFDAGVAQLARRRLGRKAEFEELGRDLRARVRVGRPQAFLEWLLGWGARARLEEPEGMKEELRAKLLRAEALYTEATE